jgi:hypothetical protein
LAVKNAKSAVGQNEERATRRGADMSNVVNELKARIANEQIIFDAHKKERLEKELLALNTGTKVTAALQSLVLELSKIAGAQLRISSIVRTSGHHGLGRAVDIGNEEIAALLLPKVATDAEVARLMIDDLIFDATVAGQQNRNQWNFNAGIKHAFKDDLLDDHRDHIHFSVRI